MTATSLLMTNGFDGAFFLAVFVLLLLFSSWRGPRGTRLALLIALLIAALFIVQTVDAFKVPCLPPPCNWWEGLCCP